MCVCCVCWLFHRSLEQAAVDSERALKCATSAGQKGNELKDAPTTRTFTAAAAAQRIHWPQLGLFATQKKTLYSQRTQCWHRAALVARAARTHSSSSSSTSNSRSSSNRSRECERMFAQIRSRIFSLCANDVMLRSQLPLCFAVCVSCWPARVQHFLSFSL